MSTEIVRIPQQRPGLTRLGSLLLARVRICICICICRLFVRLFAFALFADTEPVLLVFLVATRAIRHHSWTRLDCDLGVVTFARCLRILRIIFVVIDLLRSSVVAVILVETFKVEVAVLEIAQHLFFELCVFSVLLELVIRHVAVLIVAVCLVEEGLRLGCCFGGRAFRTATSDDFVDGDSGLQASSHSATSAGGRCLAAREELTMAFGRVWM